MSTEGIDIPSPSMLYGVGCVAMTAVNCYTVLMH